MNFLPTSAKEAAARGWDYVDVVLFTGDAYVDHPSFGAAVIGRTLEAAGYRVAIVPQPDWHGDLRDFKKMGRPRLFFGVTAGAMDSLVNKYTPTGRLRSSDAYTPEGLTDKRPDYPTIVYTKILKELFPDTPVVVGGVEASLRRLTHYDYIEKRLRSSFLVEAGADLLIYGMGEQAIIEVAQAIAQKKPLTNIRQTVYISKTPPPEATVLASFEQCVSSNKKFGENFVAIETASNMAAGVPVLVEQTGDRYVVVNPPFATPTEKECDATYDLPYMRRPAPRYKGKRIAAWDMIRHSINTHRGCYGGCSFCAISMHQGKFIASRSPQSILEEARMIAADPEFRGTISDLGGPSANMWRSGGKDRSACQKCRRPSCLFPKICVNLTASHTELIGLLQQVEAIPNVKHLFVGSGIRGDVPGSKPYMEQVIVRHTGGRLKVAPEHTEEHVLKLMRKPPWAEFDGLKRQFEALCTQHGLKHQLIPYFISAHPGCSEQDMKALKAKTSGVMTDQVQDFTPTPMTLSSVMFYTGTNPYTGEKLYVAKNKADKDRQKTYFFDYGRKDTGPKTKDPRPTKRSRRPPGRK